MKRVLIGCASSCVVLDAFLARGYDAWQCDLLPADKPTTTPTTGSRALPPAAPEMTTATHEETQ